jgi:hypothetical protein
VEIDGIASANNAFKKGPALDTDESFSLIGEGRMNGHHNGNGHKGMGAPAGAAPERPRLDRICRTAASPKSGIKLLERESRCGWRQRRIIPVRGMS